MVKEKGRSVAEVSIADEEGNTTTLTGESKVHNAIWDEIHRKQFHLAEETPICWGTLRQDFGYLTDIMATERTRAGTYQFREDCDEAMKDLLLECMRIWSKISANTATFIITKEVWETKWKKAKEDTSSPESGLHFSHYHTGTLSDLISGLHAAKTSLALHHRVAFQRWSRGLSVMLKKCMDAS